jgi:hypothetical protein
VRQGDLDNLLWFLRFYRRIRTKSEHARTAKNMADGIKAAKSRLA